MRASWSVRASWHRQVPEEDAERAGYGRGAVGKVRRQAEEANEGGDAVEQVEGGEAGDGRQHIEEIVKGVVSSREETENESELGQDTLPQMTKSTL